MTFSHDVFLSHASADKPLYVQPLVEELKKRRLTYWLDSEEIAWGDSIAGRINEGLRVSQYGLLCLSENYLSRPWPEAEMAALLAIQNASGKKRLLPLILDGHDAVLERYPLIAGLAYRSFSDGPAPIAEQLAQLIQPEQRDPSELQISIESANSGNLISISVPKRASIDWLLKTVIAHAGLKTEADVGAFKTLRVKWILVDVTAESAWFKLRGARRKTAVCVVADESGFRVSVRGTDRLEDAGVTDGMVFHLHALPEEEQPVLYCRV